ncbi:MAG TPA: hypothetical protein ENI23_01920 [bacterium]|nr:hypothetical protein [bacterium]
MLGTENSGHTEKITATFASKGNPQNTEKKPEPIPNDPSPTPDPKPVPNDPSVPIIDLRPDPQQ